ncbi:MAG TPA: sortase [Candidatus Saccharimonadales bacterium]|nr:sortase [Candidatus Saccharimonadales bacterium]
MAQKQKFKQFAAANYSRRLRFCLSLAAIYAVTAIFGWLVFRPAPYSLAQVESAKQFQHIASVPKIAPISGIPVRIVISTISVDLPVDPGTYDKATDSWTLSGYDAQYAVITPPANNQNGDTFIYGHNNHYVFWNLQYIQPGAQALVYTNNGHIFSYIYQSTVALSPNDTSILKRSDSGPPMMTVQTCSGSLFEWRQMYKFNFDKVVQ